MWGRRVVVAALGVFLTASPWPRDTWSQDRPAENATAARIADGVEKARDGKLLDAVEQFQRVLDTAGDELVPVDRHHHAPARWVVHGHLSRLPPEGVRLYRQRVDGQAAKRLEEAKKSRDDTDLQRLLADMFPSRAAEEAILELARRGFERGDFDAAEHFWRMLLPASESGLLHYPEPKTDPAAIKARLILVQLFRGERDEAKSELKAFRDQHPTTAGLLAGKTGKYVDTLTELADKPALTALPPAPPESGWPTFAGGPARDGITRSKLPYFWPDQPTKKVSLPLLRSGRFEEPRPDPLHPRALAFHPVIINGRAYVADGARVFSIDLASGDLATAAWPKGGEDTLIPTRRDVRYTLTEADGILYARLGPAVLKPAEGAGGETGSFLVALGPPRDGKEERDVLWRLNPPVGDGTTQFEGAPVVRRGKLFVAFWRQAAGDAFAGLACYRMDDPKAAPELVWQRVVGKAGGEPGGEPRYRHELVTLSGPNVVYCTHGGTVIALDAATGRPAWEYRYPRDERPALPRYRDLCPPLADGGHIYAAPGDTDRVLCLDAFTGRLIWEREGVEVIHLLGVARGRLIATFGGQVKGIRGLNRQTGADSGLGGWTIHDDGGEPTFGRGLVTEEAVVWPTAHGLRFLDPLDGTQLRSPIPGPPAGTELPSPSPGPFGNLCYADGYLVVTTATEVWIYASEAKKLGDRRKAVEADPDNVALRAELTQSLIDASEFVEAEKQADKSGEARDRLRWLLAEKVVRDGDQKQAKRIYGELAKRDGSFAAAGAVRLAEMCEDPTKQRELWRVVYGKRGSVCDENRVPYPASLYAEKRFGNPLSMHSVGLGNFGALTSTDQKLGPLAMYGYERSSVTLLDDPSLSILGGSRYGVLSSGKCLQFFAAGESHQLADPVEGASLLTFGQRIAIAGATGLGGASLATGNGRWELTTDAPSIPRLDRAIFPAASEISASTTVRNVRLDGTGVSFVHEGSAIVSQSWMWPEVRVRLAGAGHTAGLCEKYCLGSIDIAQTQDGRMLVWNSDQQPHREFPCTRKPWPELPLALDGGQFLIPDDGSAFLFDAKAGKELARYTLPGDDSLTGELPRFRLHQGDVLLLTDRNHGVEVDRLTVKGLKRAWTREPVFVGRELDEVAFAGDRFFTAAEGTLAAHGWKDGEPQWDMPLPEAANTRWKLAVAPGGLLAYPAEALLLAPDFDAIGEFRRAGWNRDGLLRAVSRSYDVWTNRELPVLVIDPADGRLIQRLTFPAAGPAAGVAVTPKGVVVVTGKGSWTLTPK
jgi:outer membrane protein assembly factor BamB